MKWTTLGKAAGLVAGTAILGLLAGCRIHVDKGNNGEEKTVQVDTPFGGVHVNTDQVSAADIGLPVYPGAQAVSKDGKHKSADLASGNCASKLRASPRLIAKTKSLTFTERRLAATVRSSRATTTRRSARPLAHQRASLVLKMDTQT